VASSNATVLVTLTRPVAKSTCTLVTPAMAPSSSVTAETQCWHTIPVTMYSLIVAVSPMSCLLDLIAVSARCIKNEPAGRSRRLLP